MFGGGGMNPRKMEQMMKQMGIDMDELDATEVIIRTEDRELVFEAPQVTKMDAQGQETYQVVGSPTETDGAVDSGDATPVEGGDEIPDDDVQLVAERAGVPAATARDALEEANGDLAAAISALE